MLRRIYARYFRGFGAAVIAVAALVTAANAGPARAAEPQPALQAQYVGGSAATP
ncbi:hypothetical protein GCM10011579_036280 [Streptomyces albiflavescens]|uniref:Uncharacterized protein n=1 Tax=Streptomyces albiflavescens TaxID=1623582 RepID=A0A917Y493_9ACTN|nr:hypothetical protein [Streptomyces albiflavescens]GGN65641.1 hypothetical protein GCM10011579_036280 [Streptomyces albiflavescens]